jgi:hypothetical protein
VAGAAVSRFQLNPRATRSPLEGSSRAAKQARRAFGEQTPRERLEVEAMDAGGVPEIKRRRSAQLLISKPRPKVGYMTSIANMLGLHGLAPRA